MKYTKFEIYEISESGSGM